MPADVGPTFAVSEIPFSYHRSWLDLSPVTGLHRTERDVHLVAHQTGMHPILSLVPTVDGVRVETSIEGAPEQLRWNSEHGHLAATFAATDVVLLRGEGVGLRVRSAQQELTPFSGTWFFRDPIDGSFIYTSYETGRRYRLTLLRGVARVHGDQALGTADRGVDIFADGSGTWECAIEEFETSRTPYEPVETFDRVVARVGEEFDSFLEGLAPWRSDRTSAAALAAYVLWSATVGPAGFLQRPAMLMSKHWMDKVWSWDHCFNALALADGAPELALDQFLTPFDHQDARGALPDSVTHSEVLYNFVKPPIHGWALDGIRARLADPLDQDTLRRIYEQLSAWSRFWLDARRVPGHQLPHYQHGNDSGWDNSTVFDRGGLVESADLTGFLVHQLRTVAALAGELGLTDDQKAWAATADDLLSAVMDQLWDGEQFVATTTGGDPVRTQSLLNSLPIILGADLPAEVSEKLAARLRGHLTTWGLATEPVSSPEYRDDGYWRGPIWAPSTVLIEDGLRRAGHVELADDIAIRFLALCEKSGFAENFDAVTGEGLRDRAYTWTASAYLLLAAAAEQRWSSEPIPTPDTHRAEGRP